MNAEKNRARQAAYYRKAISDPVWRERHRERKNRWMRNRMSSDPEFKAAVRESQRRWRKKQPVGFRTLSNLRRRIWRVLKRTVKKSSKSEQLLGCTTENLMTYIESRFQTGMTWENYGSVWQIDHIIPCAVFDLSKPEHQRTCFHFSNLQPLFAEQNRRKFKTFAGNRAHLNKTITDLDVRPIQEPKLLA